MQLFVNDQPTDCPDGCTLAQLLEQLGIPTAGTAVARNDEVIRKSAHAETVLQPSDRLEIIRAVAGG